MSDWIFDNRIWERATERVVEELIEVAQPTRWTIFSPDGDYTLTDKFAIAGIDFMTADTYMLQGVGPRSKLRLLPKEKFKALYDPETKVWFRLKVWHSGDTLSIISDGNCFYFVGKWRSFVPVYVEDFSKYTIIDLDLAIKLRERVNDGLEKANEWEDL